MWWRRSLHTDSFAEDLLPQAQSNFQGFLLFTLKYFKDHQLDTSDFMAYLGTELTAFWQAYEGRPVDELALAFIASHNSMGGGCLEHQIIDGTATLILQPFITSDAVAKLSLSDADFDQFWDVFSKIFSRLGYKFTWSRDGEQIVIKIS